MRRWEPRVSCCRAARLHAGAHAEPRWCVAVVLTHLRHTQACSCEGPSVVRTRRYRPTRRLRTLRSVMLHETRHTSTRECCWHHVKTGWGELGCHDCCAMTRQGRSCKQILAAEPQTLQLQVRERG